MPVHTLVRVVVAMGMDFQCTAWLPAGLQENMIVCHGRWLSVAGSGAAGHMKRPALGDKPGVHINSVYTTAMYRSSPPLGCLQRLFGSVQAVLQLLRAQCCRAFTELSAACAVWID
jgi:hypothetical protein